MQTVITEKSKIGRLFIESIMKPYEDVDTRNKVRVLLGVLSIETSGKSDIIIRSNITEEFWREVIEATSKYRVCAMGTPGIGKTTSTCILIRLLLKDKHIVVYHVRTDKEKGFVYCFSPKEGSTAEIDVNVVREKDFDYFEEQYNNPSIYYVIDPGQTSDNCAPPGNYDGKVIIVTSPDEKHWGGSNFLKDRQGASGIFLFYPVWTLHEILAAKSFFGRSLKEDDIRDRYEKVGGIPRHIFQDNLKFSNTLDDQTAAINTLTEHQLKKMTSNDMDSACTFAEGQPKSALMVYENSCEGNFWSFNVVVASKLVLTKLEKKNSIFMWELMVSQSVEQGGSGWKIFENICHNRMLGDIREYFDYKYFYGSKLVNGDKNSSLKLGGCKSIKGTQRSLITAAKQQEHVLFYSLDSQYKFIDSIYRSGTTFYAFQITLAKRKNCNGGSLLEMAEEVGGPSKLLFHYLTCEKNYNKFTLESITLLGNLLQGKNTTINVVCIPTPDDEHSHEGPSHKFEKN